MTDGGRSISERGALLLESALAAVAAGFLVIALAGAMQIMARSSKDAAAAHYLEKVSEAVQAYMAGEAMRVRYLEALREGEDIADGAPLTVLTIADLKGGQFLASGFPARDPYGASARIVITAEVPAAAMAPRLLRAVILLERADGFSVRQAGRILGRARVSGGHTHEHESEVRAGFANGGHISSEQLTRLSAGVLPAAGALIHIAEMPLLFPSEMAIDRQALTETLAEALEGVAGEVEKEFNTQLAGFDFRAANAGRDLSLRPVLHDPSGGGSEVPAFETLKHICPDDFTPTLQVYPAQASDSEVLAEVKLWRGASTEVRFPAAGSHTLVFHHRPWWNAIGIFRGVPLVWQGAPVTQSHLPVNTTVSNYAIGPQQTSGVLGDIWNTALFLRQNAHFASKDDSWIITRLPAFAAGDSLPADIFPLQRDWAHERICVEAKACASADGSWLAGGIKDTGAFRPRNSFAGDLPVMLDLLYAGADRCSIIAAHGVAGTLHTPISWLIGGLNFPPPASAFLRAGGFSAGRVEGSLCRHLTRDELRVIRKCVPQTENWHRGESVILRRR